MDSKINLFSNTVAKSKVWEDLHSWWSLDSCANVTDQNYIIIYLAAWMCTSVTETMRKIGTRRGLLKKHISHLNGLRPVESTHTWTHSCHGCWDTTLILWPNDNSWSASSLNANFSSLYSSCMWHWLKEASASMSLATDAGLHIKSKQRHMGSYNASSSQKHFCEKMQHKHTYRQTGRGRFAGCRAMQIENFEEFILAKQSEIIKAGNSHQV